MYHLRRIGIVTVCMVGLLVGCGGDSDENKTISCCSVCTGDTKACGNRCFPKEVICVVAPGCACDQETSPIPTPPENPPEPTTE